MSTSCQLFHKQSKHPDVDEYLEVDREPRALNMKRVVDRIQYPETARQRGLEESIVFRVLVDRQGDYVKHEVLGKGDPALIRSIEEEIGSLKFSPARLNGKRLSSWTNIPFRFEMRKGNKKSLDCFKIVEEADAILKVDPESYVALFQRGICKFKLNEFEQSLEDLSNSIEFNPARIESDELEAVKVLFASYYNRGNCHYSFQRYTEAEQDYAAAIKIGRSIRLQDSAVNKTLVSVYNYRALTYIRQDNAQAAVSDLNSALEINSFSYLSYHNRGYAHTKAGDFGQALKDFNRSLSLNPNQDYPLRSNTLSHRGFVYFMLEEHGKVLPDLEEAILLNPDNGNAYFNKGVVLLEFEKRRDACKQFTLALNNQSLSPDRKAKAIELIELHCGKR